MPHPSDTFMLYFILATLVASLILTILGIYLLWRTPKEESAADNPALRGRKAVSSEEFYRQHYAQAGLAPEVVNDVASRFAAAAHVPSGYLLPEDSFSSLHALEYRDAERFIVESAVMLQDVEERLGTKLFTGKLITLDDYIRAAALAQRFSASRPTVNS